MPRRKKRPAKKPDWKAMAMSFENFIRNDLARAAAEQIDRDIMESVGATESDRIPPRDVPRWRPMIDSERLWRDYSRYQFSASCRPSFVIRGSV